MAGKKVSIPTSVVNRLLNLMDELALMQAQQAQQGAAIDAALQAPIPEMPADVPIEGALVAKGLEL